MIVVIKDGDREERIGITATGVKGIDQTTAAMRGLVKKYAQHEDIRTLAAHLWDAVGVYNWVKTHMRYASDPKGIELIRVPTMLLRQMKEQGYCAGDCDDNTVLCCSLLAALGYTPAIIVLGKTPRAEGGKFVHVLPGFLASSLQMGEHPIRNGEVRERWGGDGSRRAHTDGPLRTHQVKTSEGWVSMMDPQEGRPIGHNPPEPMRKVYLATAEHAA